MIHYMMYQFWQLQPVEVNLVPDNASGPNLMVGNPGNNIIKDSGNSDGNVQYN